MTQAEKVKQYVDEHGSINEIQALGELGVKNLASVVRNLKKTGFNLKKVDGKYVVDTEAVVVEVVVEKVKKEKQKKEKIEKPKKEKIAKAKQPKEKKVKPKKEKKKFVNTKCKFSESGIEFKTFGISIVIAGKHLGAALVLLYKAIRYNVVRAFIAVKTAVVKAFNATRDFLKSVFAKKNKAEVVATEEVKEEEKVKFVS